MATREEIAERELEFFEERAAILEYDGGLETEEAELEALRCLDRWRLEQKQVTRNDKVDARKAYWEWKHRQTDV